MIRCLIVDDEPLALDVLESYIARLDDLRLVARLDNAVDAFNHLNRERVDLLFLDIQMPQLTGIELLRNISAPPKVIFTTAYRDYALQGYELDVVDYLLKPISFERFLRAVNKVYKTHSAPPAAPPLAGMAAHSPDLHEEAFIYLKDGKKMIKILLRDILYIESLKDYVRVRTREKTVTAYQRISYLEEKLPEDRFMRIHRSYIVALDKVEAYSTPFVEIGKTEIPIGRNYRSAVLKVLQEQNYLTE